MSVNLTINGTTYAYPSDGDPEGWGTTATSWAQAVTAGLLQKSAGLFTLTAELDLGSGYGIKSLYYKSRTANPASDGHIRLANTDTIQWRNSVNSADLALSVSSADKLIFNNVNLKPLTTNGDIQYFNSSDNQRLPIGTSGQILSVSSGGLPEWISSSAAPLPWTTNGDLLFYNSGGQRLAVGTNGQYLKVSSGLPAWETQSPDTNPDDLRIGLDFDCEDDENQARCYAKLINQGAIMNVLHMATASFAQTDFDSTNKKFGTYSFDCSGAGFGFPGDVSSPNKGSLIAWYRNLTAGDYIACNPTLGAELFLDASGYQTFKIAESTAATETTKDSTVVAGSVDRAADATFRCATAKWRINEVGGASSDLMEMERDGVDEGSQVSADTINVNCGNLNNWFFGCKLATPSWQQFLANDVLPSAMSDAWTYAGTSAEGDVFSVSDGILSSVSEAGKSSSYSKTSASLAGINLLDMNIALKLKVNSCGSSIYASQYNGIFRFQIRDDSVNRHFLCDIGPKGFTFMSNGDTSNVILARVFLDMSQWHQIWIKCSDYALSPGNPQYDIYVDGKHAATAVDGTANTTANDTIDIGKDTTYTATADIDFEYFAYGGTASAPISGYNASGNLDGVGLVKRILSDAEITDLQSTDVCSYFKAQPNYGPTLPDPAMNCYFFHVGVPIITGNTWQSVYWNQIYVPGDGVTEFYATATVTGQAGGNIGFTTIDLDSTVVGLALTTSYTDYLPSVFDVGYLPATTGVPTTATVQGKTVLGPGLHKFNVLIGSSAVGGTVTLQPNTPFLTVQKSKERKIY